MRRARLRKVARLSRIRVRATSAMLSLRCARTVPGAAARQGCTPVPGQRRTGGESRTRSSRARAWDVATRVAHVRVRRPRDLCRPESTCRGSRGARRSRAPRRARSMRPRTRVARPNRPGRTESTKYAQQHVQVRAATRISCTAVREPARTSASLPARRRNTGAATRAAPRRRAARRDFRAAQRPA